MKMFNYTKLLRYYDFLFDELADPRTNNWFLIRHPTHVLFILSLYLYFVISWGPKFMKNRNPWNLNKILIIYNFIQVAISTWLFLAALTGVWLHYSWRCEPVDHSNSPVALKIAQLTHIYFLVKMTELLDTIFFVLRKKNNQITFLHLYHHVIMPVLSWITTKYFPGGHGTLIGVINSFVHIFMYMYYMFAAMGPRYQKYLWWKKYITTLQLVQFILAFLHNSQLLFIDCGYPKITLYITLPNAILFFYLFNNFYKIAYNKKKDHDKKKNDDTSSSDSCNNCDMSKCDKNITNENISHIKSQ